MDSTGNPARILVVDDDQDIASNIFDILTEVGYRTVVATDGKKALEMMLSLPDRQCPFDLALIDYRLPGIDGASLFEQIHQLFPGFRAIMITGYASDAGVEAVRDHDRLTVLQKPVDMQSLLALIDNTLN